MDEQESQALFDELIHILQTLEMSWVVDQVNETVRFGKTETKEVKTYTETLEPGQQVRIFDQLRPTLKESSKANLPATIEYTPQEKLKLLIDAIEQVTINLNSMKDHLILFAIEETGGRGAVAFYPDDVNAPPRFALTIGDRQGLDLQKLKQLLDELRSEI